MKTYLLWSCDENESGCAAESGVASKVSWPWISRCTIVYMLLWNLCSLIIRQSTCFLRYHVGIVYVYPVPSVEVSSLYRTSSCVGCSNRNVAKSRNLILSSSSSPFMPHRMFYRFSCYNYNNNLYLSFLHINYLWLSLLRFISSL